MEDEIIPTDDLIKILEKGFHDIYEAQRLIATERIYQTGHLRTRKKGAGNALHGRSGKLMDSINNPRYLLAGNSYGINGQLNYPIYIRFLDMKRLGNWKIYNRQIWGILYSETFVEMKYHYYAWLRDFTLRTLQHTYNSNL